MTGRLVPVPRPAALAEALAAAHRRPAGARGAGRAPDASASWPASAPTTWSRARSTSTRSWAREGPGHREPAGRGRPPTAPSTPCERGRPPGRTSRCAVTERPGRRPRPRRGGGRGRRRRSCSPSGGDGTANEVGPGAARLGDALGHRARGLGQRPRPRPAASPCDPDRALAALEDGSDPAHGRGPSTAAVPERRRAPASTPSWAGPSTRPGARAAAAASSPTCA